MSIHSVVLKKGHSHDLSQEFEAGEEKGRQATTVYHRATPSSSMDNDHLDCGPPEGSLANYFASPLRTLCESAKDPEQDFISDHDIAEAYNHLCGRIRARKSDISKMKSPGSMCGDVQLLVLCISRDIRRVLPNPFESFPRQGEQPVQSYDTDPINEENMPPAMNHMLCQSALRLMSDLFMYPTLYSMFSQTQISTLLQDALSLCMLTASWAFDIERLRCTVLLMLKMQQLPLNLIRPDLTSMVNALVCVTNVREVAMSKIDGLAAICSLLQKYPILQPQIIRFLPSVLRDLKIDDLDIRLSAIQVLSGFALAKHSQLDAPLPASTLYQVSEAIHSYITKEHAKFLPPDDLLPLIVKSAISDDPRSFWKKKGPSFAISLVSIFVVLLDYRVFTSPRSLKLVISVIQATAGSRWKRVAVHSEMWKILLWAFSRIPRNDEDLKDPMAQGQDLEGWNDTRERAYRFLKQEFREGIGVAFVTILLHSEIGGRRNHEDIGKALEIVQDLMKSERQAEKLDAILLLERLLSGIGIPLHGSEGERRLCVRFSIELVDGSLAGKTFRDLTILPTAAPICDIRPLSEEEALSFWDKLSEIWSSGVQDFLLHSDDNLPHNVFEIWQALLLVQGQLTESHQHLTASSSFTSRVVSIVTHISLPLETPQAQARYLNTISELWMVMKNVFTTTWLPSPAERILASLLKKRFDLSNETVKIYWSRFCAELISVGIPTLMHVLHTKTLNPSQEEMEVTRRLWAVLAKNAAGAGIPEDNWMNLVQLLAMPIGAWNMEDSEVEIWRTTLSRTVEVGARVSQPSHVVASVVLDILGESKLDLLKNVPTVLNSLLSHLTSSPCTNSTYRFLSVIDSVLQTSYICITERKTWALECLRLIAKLNSQALDSEIIRIIAVMPYGLLKWIADEELVLTDFEHREVVVSIYGESLKKLSTLEPTLDHLCILANFLHSAFVRVQNDGLLSFERFWRSTYHLYKGVSKKDYPLAIRACLKAWSDVCDDSFADDISLGSESQSLESYTIPDSQASPEKANDDVNAPFDELVLGPNRDVIEEDCDVESSGTVTPKAKKILTLSSPAGLSSNSVADSSALLALREYQSNITSDGHVSESSFADKATKSDLKRRFELEVPRTPKRRRIEHLPNRSLGQASSNEGSRAPASVSEPVTRVPSLSPRPLASASQPSVGQYSRKRRREETPSWLGSDLKRQRGNMASSDDYHTWEQNVLSGTPEAVEHLYDDPSGVDETTEIASGDLLSPSLGQFHLRSRRRDRSQTAPEPSTAPDPESVSIPQAGQTLRRHQTTPLEGVQRHNSAQLDALQRAYAIITDTGSSQINVQEIMHARRLANQINQVLDEQMCLKFGAQQPDDAAS